MKKLLTVLLSVLILCALAGCSNGGGSDNANGAAAKTELELVNSLDQAILALSTGKCDAVALDGTTAENYVAQSNGQFAMSGVNFDLTMYGDYEGNVAAAKKGETSLIEAVNECIKFSDEKGYYRLWTAIAKVQSGTEDEAALKIVGDTPIYNNAIVDDTYTYLLDTANIELPKLDLSKADGVLKKVLDNGVLSIATSPDYPAAEFITEEGVVYGSEMMLAKYVADCLGVKLKIETMDFNAVLTAVDTGKVDMAFSGFGWKADRAEAFELSTGYVGDNDVTYHTLIVPADKADAYKSLEDFVGKHILAQASSLQQMYVEDQIVALENN
ncbi:MAG: transporter substrate-binding domain-containing protein [Erysipelotrichaceae bacterium]|nr:transporter substrate-binding domain-containing protein [Erysipelotrichaceae bacterium]